MGIPSAIQAKRVIIPVGGAFDSSGGSPEPGQIVINGTGFGDGPTVLIFKDFSVRTPDATAQIDDGTGIGAFNTAHYNTGLLPKFKTIGEKTGITFREGGTDSTTDNRLTGFVKSFDPLTAYLIAYDMGVPEGRTFAGASELETMPDVSALKVAWLSDDPLDNGEKADLCLPSWTGANFSVSGNNAVTSNGGTPNSLSLGSAFDFNAWNGFLVHQKAGADPFNDAGLSEAMLTTGAGTNRRIRTSLPTFPLGNATAAQYTHLSFPGWSGNGSQNLMQHLFSYIYFATGENSRARVELMNSATYTAATRRVTLPPDSWTDTSVAVTPPALLCDGLTHYCITNAAGEQTIGVRP